jgi:hypothetical protein
MKISPRAFWLPFAVVLILLLLAALPTLQTIPNGSEHYYMIDVGETQIVLNVWGTLHATGYPLYIMMSSAVVAVLRALGIDPATAPAITSLIWGIAALTLLYALLARLTYKPLLSAVAVLLIGLTRSVWIHLVIAEIYSFGLLIMIGLLALTLWEPPIRHRLYWLALLGGIGVAHHRAIAMMIPALVYSVWGDLREEIRRKRIILALVACFALGSLGFAQYIYLPLRAQASAAWVYGEPGTWAGLWDQFSGREAERFIGAPGTLDGILANIRTVTNVLITDVTLPGLIAGIAGLTLGARNPSRRRLVMMMLLNAGVALLFHYLFYTDILSALILPVIVLLGVGWLLLAEEVIEWASTPTAKARRLQNIRRTEDAADNPGIAQPFSVGLIPLSRSALAVGGVFIASFLLAIHLYTTNAPFITSLTHDPTGVQTIVQVSQTPPDSALMIAWGPRHFAAGFARDVMGDLQDVTLVDHKEDFRALAARMPIYTPDFTFYRYPVSWWAEQLGASVYLHAEAQGLVALATQPERGTGDALAAQMPTLECGIDALTLRAAWYTPDAPTRDLSVFVHLLDGSGAVIAQGDQAAPVFGWRPLTTWTPGEIVRDVYTLPRPPAGEMIRFGLYSQREDGTFENVIEEEKAVACAG